jgi:ADP-ribosylglycohydrolase
MEADFDYDLSLSCDEIRPDYGFDETCPGTVPHALMGFLEASNFEDAIRDAISLGGDSDTLAAITGSVAEGFWGIPGAVAIKVPKCGIEDHHRRALKSSVCIRVVDWSAKVCGAREVWA